MEISEVVKRREVISVTYWLNGMLKLVVCSVFNDSVFCLPVGVTPKKVEALLHCEMFRATCLAMFSRHCGGTSCTKHFTV